MDRNNRLQRWRVPHRHLQRIEPTPGNSKHADASIRPTLVRQPIDDLLAVDLLVFGIFALGRHSFPRAEAANIHPHANVSAPREKSMLGIVTRRCPVIFAIRQVFEQGREFLRWLRAVRHVEGRGQADAIFHRDPRPHHAHAVGWRRRRFTSGYLTRRNAEEKNVKGTDVKHEPANPDDDCSCQEVSRKAQVTDNQSCGSCSRRSARRSIPSCSAFLYRWLRSRPSDFAASLTLCWLRFNSARITSRSNDCTRLASVPDEAKTPGGAMAAVLGRASCTVARSTSPSVANNISRSTILRSSRTLPGQEYACITCIASGTNGIGFHPFCALTCCAKCSTNAGMSSRRSRSGGRNNGKT